VAAAVDPLGVLLALTAAVCQVIFVVVSRQSYAAAPADAATVVVLGVSAAGAAAAAVLTRQAGDLVVPLQTLEPWPYLLQAGVLAAGVSSYLFLVAIRRIGGTRTGILMLLEPVAGTVLAAIVLNEAIGGLQVLGGVLVLAGAAVLQVRARRHQEPIAEEGAASIT
jgi:DME family drug/metabolite transporter